MHVVFTSKFDFFDECGEGRDDKAHDIGAVRTKGNAVLAVDSLVARLLVVMVFE
jgi:hypothetical protein